MALPVRAWVTGANSARLSEKAADFLCAFYGHFYERYSESGHLEELGVIRGSWQYTYNYIIYSCLCIWDGGWWPILSSI